MSSQHANPAISIRDRIRGAVLGAAIGDAMGHATEFIKSFEAIREKFGPQGVTKFERYWTRGEKRFAPYTDDTQMAEATLRALLWGRGHDADLDLTMRYLARLYVLWAYQPQGGHRAPGNACMSGCRMLATGTPWFEAGAADAGGCGSVMRVYPFGIVFANDLERCEAWAVEHSKLTHGAPSAFAACAAMALGTAAVIHGRTPNEVAEVMERLRLVTSPVRPRLLHERKMKLSLGWFQKSRCSVYSAGLRTKLSQRRYTCFCAIPTTFALACSRHRTRRVTATPSRR